MATLAGHEDEVLDVCFDYTGQLIATASADGTTTEIQYTVYHTNGVLFNYGVPLPLLFP